MHNSNNVQDPYLSLLEQHYAMHGQTKLLRRDLTWSLFVFPGLWSVWLRWKSRYNRSLHMMKWYLGFQLLCSMSCKIPFLRPALQISWAKDITCYQLACRDQPEWILPYSSDLGSQKFFSWCWKWPIESTLRKDLHQWCRYPLVQHQRYHTSLGLISVMSCQPSRQLCCWLLRLSSLLRQLLRLHHNASLHMLRWVSCLARNKFPATILDGSMVLPF